MLKILLVVLLAAIGVGFVTNGRVTRMARMSLRAVPLLYSALIIALIPLFVATSHRWSHVLITAGYALLAAFLVRNIRQPTRLLQSGVTLLCLGWLLNAAPVIANGGMPLSLGAYRQAGLTETPTPSKNGFFKIIIAKRDTPLRSLGDTIPIRSIQQVVSVGDLVLALGVGVVIVGGMHLENAPTDDRY